MKYYNYNKKGYIAKDYLNPKNEKKNKDNKDSSRLKNERKIFNKALERPSKRKNKVIITRNNELSNKKNNTKNRV